MTGDSSHTSVAAAAKPAIEPVPFHANVELLRWFVARREPIAERIQGVLNAQRKPLHYLQDVQLLDRELEDCFFTLPGIGYEHAALKRRL